MAAILLATTNKAKIERIRKLLKVSRSEVKVDVPTDLGLEVIEVEEGNNLLDNARAKTRAYLGKTGLPIVGMDAGFFVDGEELDPALVKRNALDGRMESEFSQHEIGQRMLVYYQNIARNHGGQVEAYWKDVFVLVLPDGTEKTAESIRPVVLTAEVHGEVDDFMPLRSLYYSKITGKYAAEAIEEDEMRELEPVSRALREIIV
ncbi:MAG: non-canonical purine NTP pyrophosphatase [Patescibacteria group bacterium]|nr:non-canonical purine NTP pyrophosphatase [Patescibacteria group bacterium]